MPGPLRGDALHVATILWEGSTAQSRLIDGALAGATEAEQSLRTSAEQAESIAASSEEQSCGRRRGEHADHVRDTHH